MKIITNKFTLFLAVYFVVSGFYGCVPSRQFEDLQKKDKTCQDENDKLKKAGMSDMLDDETLKETHDFFKNLKGFFYEPTDSA